ncbi:hypothetical protein WG906_01060 [Pedobacter sp. P351]|uniref:hypothetical protein n=1 Tax=Pedobacter superstes TaxID=3133441 RepID=UPI003096DDA6
MSKLIKLTYQQLIDSASEGTFEKAIFNCSYEAFISKSEVYNRDNKYLTFSEIVEKDGRANSLHFKLTSAASHLLESLNKKIPNLSDHLGNPIPFKIADLQLLNSCIEDESRHRIKILYTTEVLHLHEIIGDYLLLSLDKDFDWGKDELRQTFMLKTQACLSISAYCEKKQECLTEGSLKLVHSRHLFSELGII